MKQARAIQSVICWTGLAATVLLGCKGILGIEDPKLRAIRDAGNPSCELSDTCRDASSAGSSAGGNADSGGMASGGAPGGGAGGAAGGGGATGACTLATFPRQPSSVVTPGGQIELVGVMSGIDMGDSAPNLASEPTRWQTIGFDVDGVCTFPPNLTKNQKCRIPPYAAGVPDGPNGQDNALGRDVQSTRDRMTSFSSETYSKALRNGVANVVIHVTGYNGEPNDDQVRLEALVSAPFDSPPRAKGEAPKWDGSDVWPIASDAVKNGNRNAPLFADNNAYVTNGKVVATLGNAALRLVVGLDVVSTVHLSLALHGEFLVCDLEKTTIGRWGWGLKHCTLAARLIADDLIHQLSHFPDPSSSATASFPLCTDSPLYEAFKLAICQLVDVSSSGFDQPSVDCDAMSMGVNFDTEPGLLGDVFTINPIGEQCKPGAQPSLDSCETLVSTDAGTGTGAGGSSPKDAGGGG